MEIEPSTHNFQSDKAYSSPAVETALRVFSKLSAEQKRAKKKKKTGKCGGISEPDLESQATMPQVCPQICCGLERHPICDKILRSINFIKKGLRLLI